MDLVDYFDNVQTAFEHTAQMSTTACERYIKVAGTFTVRLRFASPSIVPYFLPAFEHLLAPPVESPDLTICVWEKGTKPPYPTWKGLTNFKSVELLTGEHVKVSCELSPPRLTVIDQQRNAALFWISDVRQIPGWEQCCPFRSIIHWWAGSRQHHLVHAAAIGTAAGGALIVGPGGSGKSSTALTCIRPGFSYVSDDYCLVGYDGSRATAYSIYSCAKVDMNSSGARFAHLQPLMIDRHELHAEKEVLFVHQHFPELTAGSCELRAILVAKVTGVRETRIRDASKNETAAALIPSTMSQLPGSNVEDFYGIIKLTRLLPCYILELGTDSEQIPPAIERIISQAVNFSASPALAEHGLR